jgi:hypothetical protein
VVDAKVDPTGIGGDVIDAVDTPDPPRQSALVAPPMFETVSLPLLSSTGRLPGRHEQRHQPRIGHTESSQDQPLSLRSAVDYTGRFPQRRRGLLWALSWTLLGKAGVTYLFRISHFQGYPADFTGISY